MCTLRVKDAKGGCPCKIVTGSDDEDNTKALELSDVIIGDIEGALVILQVRLFHTSKTSTMSLQVSRNILHLLCILLFAVSLSIAKPDQENSQGIMSQNPLNGTVPSYTSDGDTKTNLLQCLSSLCVSSPSRP